MGNPQSEKVPQSIPTIETSPNTGSTQASLKEAWTNIIEEHLLKQKPTKQVYVGAGLPTLPRRIVEKMLNWEYINFNELLPLCDPGAEEEQGLTQTPEQFMLFSGLGLLQHGHQVKYSFLQWASCFVTYMAVMASHGNNITHMCAYFNIILKANREFAGGMCSYYDANYRQKAEATPNKDWSVIDTSLFSQCFTGRARKAQRCINCSSLKHDLAECPCKKGKHAANEDIKGFYRNNKNKGWMYASTGTTTTLVTPHHAATNMNASSASQKSTRSWIGRWADPSCIGPENTSPLRHVMSALCLNVVLQHARRAIHSSLSL